MPVGKRLRFEVFKRDKFTCQYCGKKAPDIVLHADHIHPKSAGGSDDLLNLITSCIDCNLGKSDKLLADASVVEKQRDQLAQLQERKEQIEMMMEWQSELQGFDRDVVEQIAGQWCLLCDWEGLTENAKAQLQKWIKKFSAESVIKAMYTAHAQYVVFDNEDKATSESTRDAFWKIGGICHLATLDKEKPFLKDLYYIRKIVENRCTYFNKQQATQLLKDAFYWDASPEHLKEIARRARNWSEWRDETTVYVTDLQRMYEVEPE